MKFAFVGRCTRIFRSDKNGKNYLDFDDMEAGGQVKLAVDGTVPGLKVGDTVRFDGVVRGRIAQGGGVNMEYIDGKFTPATVSIS